MGASTLNIYGASQELGYCMWVNHYLTVVVFFMPGDATSSFVTDPVFTTDKVSLFARSAGVNKVVADWLHTGGAVDFKATPTVNSTAVFFSRSHSYIYNFQ